MKNWNLRQPAGKINEDYPFDDSYKALLNGEVYAFVITQEEGMNPEVVSKGLRSLMEQLQSTFSLDNKSKFQLITGKEKKDVATFSDLALLLEENAGNIQSPWFWDGIKGIIKAGDMKILIQPESDGMDIAFYISGEKTHDVYAKLEEWVRLESVTQSIK